MTKDVVMNEAAQSASGSGTYKWSLTLYEDRGTVWIRWSTDAPFRAQQGRLCLYAGSFPSDPTKAEAWRWDNEQNPFNTGKPWGSGWCGAWIAEKSPNGPYTYVAKTGLTTEI